MSIPPQIAFCCSPIIKRVPYTNHLIAALRVKSLSAFHLPSADRSLLLCLSMCTGMKIGCSEIKERVKEGERKAVGGGVFAQNQLSVNLLVTPPDDLAQLAG